MTTGIAFGIAPGAATAGWMIDALGASRGFYVSVISGVLAALLAWLTLAGREIPPVSEGTRQTGRGRTVVAC
ncbi:MAG: hypothetical protein WKF82_01570 [Nocardioidaceae bacterium]